MGRYCQLGNGPFGFSVLNAIPYGVFFSNHETFIRSLVSFSRKFENFHPVNGCSVEKSGKRGKLAFPLIHAVENENQSIKALSLSTPPRKPFISAFSGY
jgi:hypothetical protein